MIPIRGLRAPVYRRVEFNPAPAPSRVHKYFWTPEMEAVLVRLWSDGHTAEVIAEKMGGGLSRMAVIGKARRMGLSQRRSTPRRAAG
jgi:hypothetical protein